MSTEIAAQETPLTADEASAAWAEELAARKDPAHPAASEPSTPAPDVTPEPTESKAPAQAELTPMEKRLAALEATNAELKANLDRTAGRVSALQSVTDAARAAAKATADAPSKSQIDAAAEDPEEWKQLISDFPDWGVAFEKKMDAKIAGAMRAQPKAAPADDVATIVQREVAQLEIARVDRKHPTWRDTVRTQEFQTWKAAQAPEIQALERSESSDDAIEMLNLYEGSKAVNKTTDIAQRRKAALDSAAVDGKPRQQSSAVKPAGDLTPQELWALEKRQREQRRLTA